MKQVIEILMKRDDMTEVDARDLAEETLEEMKDALAENDIEGAESIFEGNLGLELDYLPGFILG